MRTIPYILTGRPFNIDDCIDLGKKHLPDKIDLKLFRNKFLNHELGFELTSLEGIYYWTFGKRTYSVTELYGGILDTESRRRQVLSYENANRRLKARLTELQNLGYVVNRTEEEFKDAR